MNNFKTFLDLHQSAAPLLFPNAWDAASAMLLQQQGAKAVATSSAALAWSLGYADGGALPRAELLAAVRRMARVLQVPLTIDLEHGYSDSPQEVAALMLEVAQCGAAGINLEDGATSPQLLVEKIFATRQALAGTDLFINARTDVYLRGLAQGAAAIDMTLARLQAYRTAGADGAFVPGLSNLEDVARIVPAIGMPLNLMTVPGIPAIADLCAAGVRRVSVGPALFQASYGRMRVLAQEFLEQQDITDLFIGQLPYDVMNNVAERAIN